MGDMEKNNETEAPTTAAPPAAPASEPAVRPLSEQMRYGIYLARAYADEVAALEADLTAARTVLIREGMERDTARVRSMREACVSRVREWGGKHTSAPTLIEAIARDVARLPLDTGTATDAGGEAPSERCNWLGCHCGGLGNKTEFVPMALEDVSQLLAEVATFHRWGATRMQGLDRLMRRLDWYRKRARAWKAKAKEAVAGERERCLAWLNARAL
jgi:hypothetical protein